MTQSPIKQTGKKKTAKKSSMKKKVATKDVKDKKAGSKTGAKKKASKKGKGLTPEQLKQKNLDLFKVKMPGIYKLFSEYQPVSELVWLDNGEPDVRLRGIYLYEGEGAYTNTTKKMEGGEARFGATRLSFSRAGDDGICPHGQPYFRKLMKKVEDEGIEFGDKPLEMRSYYVVMFGIGLAPHLEKLIVKGQPKALIICDVNPEFIYHSLSVFDWGFVFDYLQENDAMMEIQFIANPEGLSQFVASRVRAVNPAAYTSIVVNTHYHSEILERAKRMLFEKSLRVALMGLGFFEDDMTMINHSYRNLVSGNQKILKHLMNEKRYEIPVFILGNGPSLDNDLDFVRENQHKGIVVSCGTALDPLLHAGIHPDFQIQIERDIGETAIYEITRRDYDISDIVLVASTTVYPDIPKMFDETVFFFRPGLGVVHVLGTSQTQVLSLPDPSVVNAGLSFGLHMGFKNYYLFGCDMGAKSKDYHHAKKSVYNVEDPSLPDYLQDKMKKKLEESFNIEIPGNFGGTVLASSLLQWIHTNVEVLLQKFGAGCNFYNCSDGAFIRGTKPVFTSKLNVPDWSDKKKEVMQDVVESFPTYTREMFDAAWKRADVKKRATEILDVVRKAYDDSDDLTDKIHLVKIMSVLRPGDAVDGTAMLLRGTLMLFIAGMEYYLEHAATREDQINFEKIYRQGIHDLCDGLEQETHEDINVLLKEYAPAAE